MKTTFALKSLAIAAIVLAAAACKDDEKKLNDEAKFDGKSIKLESLLVSLDDAGRDHDGATVHDHDMTFYSEGFTIDNDLEVTGTGDVIRLNTVTSVSFEAVEVGEYSKTDEAVGEAAAYTFHDGSVTIGFSPGTSAGTTYQIVSGVLKSSDVEGSLRYEFEGTTEGGKSLKFSYSGNTWSELK